MAKPYRISGDINQTNFMKNLFDLTGKVALVTGASSGMGKAIAEAQGAQVAVSSNDTEGGMQRLKNSKIKKHSSYVFTKKKK